MVDLKRSEIRIIEETVGFPNGFGYVLDFSDRTIAEFFEDEFGIDFNDSAVAGDGSKRTRLTTFLQRADPLTATKVLRSLWDRREGLVMRQGKHLDPNEERATQNAFLKIVHSIDGRADALSSDALDLYERDRTLEELIADIERALHANKPEAAMDHLHTYCMKKFAHLLTIRGIDCTEVDALHARFGKYRKALIEELELTEFTDRALKMMISLFAAFNEIRNNHSLAHDNPILEPAEARFIFENVSSALRFVRSVESIRYDQ
tara:strand:+ start:288 stop:1076 length:789 start_codon:yes stop_codon:yes gene_type:complete